MRHFIITTFLFVSCVLATAQTTIDTAAINRLLEQAKDHVYSGNYQQADSQANLALTNSEQARYPQGIATAYRTLGLSAEYQRKYEDALKLYHQSLENWQSIPDSSMIGCVCQDLSIVLGKQGDYHEQLKLATRGFEIFSKIKDSIRMGDLALELANVYKDLGKIGVAKRFYKMGIQYYNSSGYDKGQAIANYGLANLYNRASTLDSASIHIGEAIQFFLISEDTSELVQSYNLQGAIQEAQEKYAEAEESYLTSVDLGKLPNDSILVYDALLNLTQIEIYKGREEEAAAYLEQARSFLAERGSELDLERIKSRENGLRILEIQKEKQRLLMLIGGLIIIVIASIAVVYILQQKHKERKATDEFIFRESKLRYEKDSLKYQKEVEELLRVIERTSHEAREAGVKEERKKISKVVHNRVGSELAATRWRLQTLCSEIPEDTSHKEELQNIDKMILKAFKNSRSVERLLENENRDWLSEITHFFNSLRTFRKSDKPQIAFQKHVKDLTLRNEGGHAIYQIFQVATANTLLHAEAENLICQLNQIENELILTIEDDGKGFDLAEEPDGKGLNNLRGLVEGLNGQVQIDSAIGKGTTITCTIPINH